MVSTAGIIIIGDEILSGRTKDTNINWIATELNNIGVRLIEARIISDDSETIIETVKNFTKKFKTVKIGSYPYFKPGNFGTSIVLRSEYESLLNQASQAVLSAIIKLGGIGKIVEENELDERSF